VVIASDSEFEILQNLISQNASLVKPNTITVKRFSSENDISAITQLVFDSKKSGLQKRNIQKRPLFIVLCVIVFIFLAVYNVNRINTHFDLEVEIIPQIEGSLVQHISFNQKKEEIAFVAGLDTIQIWDTKNGSLIHSLEKHTEPQIHINMIQWLEYSPDGKYLFFYGSNGTGKIIKTADWTEYMNISIPVNFINRNAKALTFNSSANWFAAVIQEEKDSWELDIVLFDTATKQEIRRTPIVSYSGIRYITFSPDDKFILAACNIDGIKKINAETGEIEKTIQTTTGSISHTSDGNGIAYSPDGSYLARSGQFGDSVSLYNFASGKEIIHFINILTENEWIAITPEGYYNASLQGDEYIQIRLKNEVYELHQVSKMFYHPEIVQARLRH
jgi:WD40 repeat protein